ncbi:ubiquinol-cytochrome c reductase iron-sulfur subunit [Azospirillum sp.]|uniref:ubiquinol-cytochrome c reductase iron-sulfur subunit n=1 Tax=Azospirillum sp. TaxID=34012 RepID=UPI002D59BF92|nr:ubiquinol-cytochrome c reductase iron-sulfur subunit [Azospirillum sp.]HYD70198.1 ubiquinol-cytochrome c reductase iron-sulfur subunit [Azospirillum sp.]
MATTTHPSGTGAHAAPGGEGPSRRDFLYLTTAAVGAVGVASAVWPFVDSMNPAADTLALASIDVDLAPVQEGQAITVTWRGKPVFIRHRTAKEIEEAKKVNVAELRDPEADDKRVKKAQWLVLVGVCTHLGCIPLGQKPTDPRGDFDGWFCPCHGSHYDTAGRIRKGPAPANLVVPQYAFTSDTQIKLG